MDGDDRRLVGASGEELACEHLRRRGYRILERNYRTRWGELDVVAFDGRTLAFCEVKSRRTAREDVRPFEAVGPRKRAQVRKMAGSWLIERPEHPYAPRIRFDAIGVIFDRAGRLVRLDHLEGAF